MTRREVANFLENYNAWRRGKHDDMPNPRDIGSALALASEYLRDDSNRGKPDAEKRSGVFV